MRRPLLSVVVSHPIQYHVPLFRRLAASDVLRLRVEFLSRHGVEESFDRGFGEVIRFDVPLVDGFDHRWHRSVFPAKSPGSILGQTHPQMALGSTLDSDVVLLHGYTQASMWIAALGCAARRAPLMLRGESRLSTEVHMSAAKRRFKRAFVGRLVRSAAVCLPIGRSNRDFYLAYGVPRERLVDAPYSVDNEYFSAPRARVRKERDQRLKMLDLNPALPTVVFAGKLVPWKRPRDVLEVAKARPGGFNLLVVGSGSLGSALERDYADLPNVRFLGLLNQSELREAYCLSDVSVLPSEFEPWGLAVNESMAAGCLPVASDAVGSARDLVEPTTGCVSRVADVGDLGEKLDRAAGMVGDKELLAEVWDAVEMFSIERTAQGIERATLRALKR